MSIIESADYEATRQRLMKDPVVIEMASELRLAISTNQVDKATLVHNDDPDDPRPTPRFEFMQASNAEYRTRGGTDGGHLGGIAEALLRLL